MKPLLRLAIVVVALAAPAAIGQSTRAAQPPYLILRTPDSVSKSKDPRAVSGAPARVVTAPRYAYGWFGVAPRRHWSRHFGYYRNFTQWSAR